MSIELKPAYTYKDEVRALFSEYTDMLIEGDNSFKEYLEIQNYDEELNHLDNKYGIPNGRYSRGKSNRVFLYVAGHTSFPAKCDTYV